MPVSEDTQISVDCIAEGPDSIESNTDESLAASLIIKDAIKAEKEGADALIIYCFSDLAVDAVRENVEIPVIGPGEVTLSAAAMLSNRFTVVTTTEGNISRTYRRLKESYLTRKVDVGQGFEYSPWRNSEKIPRRQKNIWNGW